jgi:tetraacyldisaccharide 4'-kinase
MGGRGKTPLVAHIARVLLAAGERPAILSRGYGRRIQEDGVVVVSDGLHRTADVDRAGDEPLMLARAVPEAMVLVSDVRSIAKVYADRVLGATVTILDDGFQHRAARRDIDLVVVTADDLKGRAVPLGRLRESPSALARATAVIADDELDPGTRAAISIPVFNLRRSIGVPVPIDSAAAAFTVPSDAPIVALAGIAAPERFERALRDRGWRVARLLKFRDHHRYNRADLARVATAAREVGAPLVLTTEKDAVRLLPLRPLPFLAAAVPLAITLDGPEPFEAWLVRTMAERRR